ncbi:MAG: AmmeMemoRadiSam system protein B [Desulfurococcaceae archaeon]
MGRLRKVRRPAVAGYFYPSDRGRLIESIEWCFKHKLGPGDLPKLSTERRRNTIGYVVPHAGYMYSGPIVAHAYYDMAGEGIPETAIILGTNHTGYGKPISIYPEGLWGTPLGQLQVDSELGTLVTKYSELADFDVYAHLEEHSIEVQLPFLQYIYGDKVKILPIVVGIHTPEASKDLASAILKATRELNRDVVVLASSDFNHYEPHEVTVEKDMSAINKVLELNTEEFYRTIVERDISICGPGGIMTLMEIAKSLNARGTLLMHATSGDVGGDKSAVVGYVSVKFYL